MNIFDDLKRRPRMGELLALVAVADCGSLSAAAAQLGCTQSNISHALGALEERLGATLLLRTRGGSIPTELGWKMVDKARAILALSDEMAELAGHPAPFHGRIKLATYRSVATHLLPAASAWLADHHPGVLLEIEDGCTERTDVERMVRAQEADLGIAHLPAGDGLDIRPFYDDEYMAVVPAGFRPDAADRWMGLSALPFIALRCTGAQAIMEQCHADGLTARPVASFTSDSTVLAAVLQQHGFTILPRLAATPVPPGLCLLPLPLPAQRRLALLALPDNRKRALLAVRAALQAVQAVQA
ncbi:MAG TPA: LysR family transcriptional regulator [Burkholderiaceae bacterium]